MTCKIEGPPRPVIVASAGFTYADAAIAEVYPATARKKEAERLLELHKTAVAARAQNRNTMP